MDDVSKFFCTAGRGTEPFIEQELQQRFQASEVIKTDGKVFFQCKSCDSAKLLSLKTVERLFVEVLHKPQFSMYGCQGLDYLLQTVDSIETWKRSLEQWRHFQELNAQSQKPRDEEDDMKKEECGTASAGSDSTDSTNSYSFDTTSTDSSALRVKKRKSEQGGSTLTFRVSCKCVARFAKHWAPKELAQAIGVRLSRKLGWEVNLRSPAIEILVQINCNGLVVGMPVTRRPLSERPYMHVLGLRSPVAWIMGYLADIKVGNRVLDPMCGVATVLIETARSWPTAHYYGSDIHSDQLAKARSNIQQVSECHMELLQADVRVLPIASESIDRIICDVPFGMNHSTKDEVRQLYPIMLATMNRVLKPGGQVVLLTSSELKDYLTALVDRVCTYGDELPERATDSTEATQTVAAAADWTQTATAAADCLQSATKPEDCTQTAGRAADCPHTATTAVDCTQTATTAVDFMQTTALAADWTQTATAAADCLQSATKPEDCTQTATATVDCIQTATTAASSNFSILEAGNCDGLKVLQLPNWLLRSSHYLKLGNTHAYVCVFTKLEKYR